MDPIYVRYPEYTRRPPPKSGFARAPKRPEYLEIIPTNENMTVQDILDYIAEKQSDLFDTDEDEDNSELFPEELLARWDLLERDKYDVPKIIKHTFLELNF